MYVYNAYVLYDLRERINLLSNEVIKSFESPQRGLENVLLYFLTFKKFYCFINFQLAFS